MPRGRAWIILSVCAGAYANFIRGVEPELVMDVRFSSALWSDCGAAGVKSAAAVFSSGSVCEALLNKLANEFGLIGLWEQAEISDEIL